MGHLLRAELTKLRRPLTLWVAVVAVAASMAFAWQGARNASLSAEKPSGPGRAETCADLSLPPGPLCAEAIAVGRRVDAYRRQQAASRPDTRHNADPGDARPVENPLAAGKLAAGFMASLPGGLLILFLAAAHLGTEWDQRTMKVLLTQRGRRWQVVAAKGMSLWLLALALLALVWMALAVLSPVLRAAYPLPGPALSWSGAWSAMVADVARAPVAMALFVAIGLATAAAVRSALGAVALATGIVVTSMVVSGNLPALARFTPAYWVSGWMQFRSHGFVIYHFWVDAFPGHTAMPSVFVGTIGVAGTVVVAAWVALRSLQRADVRG